MLINPISSKKKGTEEEEEVRLQAGRRRAVQVQLEEKAEKCMLKRTNRPRVSR
jgi:hypothetical protein